MQRLLRELFFISYIITFTIIYGNLIMLLMNKIAITKQLQNNTELPFPTSLSLKNNTTTKNINLQIHYPTMLILLDDNENNNNNNIMF